MHSVFLALFNSLLTLNTYKFKNLVQFSIWDRWKVISLLPYFGFTGTVSEQILEKENRKFRKKNELITINIASFRKVYSWSIWRKAVNDSPKNSHHPLSNFQYVLEHCNLVFVSLGFVTFYHFQQNVRLFFRLQTQTINPIKFSILRSLLSSMYRA